MKQHSFKVQAASQVNQDLCIDLQTFSGTLLVQGQPEPRSAISLTIVAEAPTREQALEILEGAYTLGWHLPEIRLRSERLPGMQSLSAELLVPPETGAVRLVSQNGRVLVRNLQAQSLIVVAHNGGVDVSGSNIARISVWNGNGKVSFEGRTEQAELVNERGDIQVRLRQNPCDIAIQVTGWAKRGSIELLHSAKSYRLHLASQQGQQTMEKLSYDTLIPELTGYLRARRIKL